MSASHRTSDNNISVNVNISSKGLGHHERKSLQVLQHSSKDDILVGTGVNRDTKSGNDKCTKKDGRVKSVIIPSKKPVRVFVDKDADNATKNLSKYNCKATQTEGIHLTNIVEELQPSNKPLPSPTLSDHSLVSGDEVPASYWQQLAEERRVALAEALEENKILHQELKELAEKNVRLEEVVQEAKTLASLLESVVSDDEDEEGKDSSIVAHTNARNKNAGEAVSQDIPSLSPKNDILQNEGND